MPRSDAMPLCGNCLRQPCQVLDICWAAKQEEMLPEQFVLKYWKEFNLDTKNRFLCTDCREKLSNSEGETQKTSETP